MRAAVLRAPGPIDDQVRLSLQELSLPEPGPGQVRLRVEACGVCHTDLHVVEAELPPLGRPVVPGHQVVGRVESVGAGADPALLGQRVGLGWLGWTDGTCRHCQAGQENLCLAARFTGYQVNGGYAEACLADASFVYPLPDAANPPGPDSGHVVPGQLAPGAVEPARLAVAAGAVGPAQPAQADALP